MNADAAVLFLQALGAQKIRVKSNGWVEARCPLATWTHKNQQDASPSFGLSVKPGERSHYSCFACRSGSAEELLQTLELYTKAHYAVCHQLLEDEPKILPLPEYGEFPSGDTLFVEWPAYWIESFKIVVWADFAANYLFDRGVTSAMCYLYDLRFDPKRQMVVAPYRDVFGRLAGARGRSILPNVSGPSKHFDYSWQSKNNCRLVWYGEEALQQSGPVVIVEGQFDCWRTRQAYPKTIANLTARPTMEKMKKLGDCPFIIQIPDRDEAGEMSTGIYAKFCAQLGLGYKMLWLDEGVKDPAEAHVDYLRERIEGLL